jgi:NitT/TauT family transport system ATP-binding protein
MAVELLKIWERDRKTIVFITHDIDEAVFLADRVVVMSASPGRFIETIPIDLPRPRSLHLRSDPKFVAYRERIWDVLEEQVRSSLNWQTSEA